MIRRIFVLLTLLLSILQLAPCVASSPRCKRDSDCASVDASRTSSQSYVPKPYCRNRRCVQCKNHRHCRGQEANACQHRPSCRRNKCTFKTRRNCCHGDGEGCRRNQVCEPRTGRDYGKCVNCSTNGCGRNRRCCDPSKTCQRIPTRFGRQYRCLAPPTCAPEEGQCSKDEDCCSTEDKPLDCKRGWCKIPEPQCSKLDEPCTPVLETADARRSGGRDRKCCEGEGLVCKPNEAIERSGSYETPQGTCQMQVVNTPPTIECYDLEVLVNATVNDAQLATATDADADDTLTVTCDPSPVPTDKAVVVHVTCMVSDGTETATCDATVTVTREPLTCNPSVRINEFHYDNEGTDMREFIEIQSAIKDLSGYSLYLYNGANGKPYGGDPITGLEVNEYGYAVETLATNGLQNGDSEGVSKADGIALVLTSGDETKVCEFISYEGTLTATEGPAKGETSTDVGVEQTGTTPKGASVMLIGGTWTLCDVGTPGKDNVCIEEPTCADTCTGRCEECDDADVCQPIVGCCTSDDDCDKNVGETCKAHECVPQEPTCADTCTGRCEECDDADVCQPIVGCCTSDDDCDKNVGETCVAYECVPPSCTPPTTCTEDSECCDPDSPVCTLDPAAPDGPRICSPNEIACFPGASGGDPVECFATCKKGDGTPSICTKSCGTMDCGDNTCQTAAACDPPGSAMFTDDPMLICDNMGGGTCAGKQVDGTPVPNGFKCCRCKNIADEDPDEFTCGGPSVVDT